MIKIGVGVRLVCASVLGFIGGVFTMTKHREQETQKAKGELIKVFKELQRTRELLESKDKEISTKIDEALESEREQTVDNLLKFQKKIKNLESQIEKNEKKDDTAP